MDLKKIGVVGIGTMGRGIGQIIAQSGCEAYVTDIEEDLINKAISKIEKSQTMAKLIVQAGLEWLNNCDLIIEAVSEDFQE